MAAAGDPGRVDGSVADVTHELYRQYGRQIYAYCLHHLRSREEAEDAVQTTFLNAFRGLQRGTVARSEQAWLYKIAQNVCFARRASSGRRLRLEAPNDFEILQETVPSQSSTGSSLELMGLDEALEKMPENQRRAILLREWQGLSYREIAEQLGLSQGAVEMLIFRARRSLATALEQPAADERKTGKAKSGWSFGSLIAAMKSLFSGAAVVKMAAVAVSAAVVSTSTAHSIVHRLMRDISSAHLSAVAHPTAAATPQGATLPSPAPRRQQLAQLAAWTPAGVVHHPLAAPSTTPEEASEGQPVVVQDPVVPAAGDATTTGAATPADATVTAGATSPAPAQSAASTSAAAQPAAASANATTAVASTPPRAGMPAARPAPLPSSTATLPGSSTGSRPGSAQQAPLPSSGATLPGGSGAQDSTAQNDTSTAGDGGSGATAQAAGGGSGGHKHGRDTGGGTSQTGSGRGTQNGGHGHGAGGGDSSTGGGASSGSSDPSDGSTTTTTTTTDP
ncbi:MAG TPA: sigma-70 family RNA polymerase sigma factor, partial [Gaiellaceae bacterium]|nr:sigma-70 family RNA polymerase sigma factor [Gaiellaceae bacterium]